MAGKSVDIDISSTYSVVCSAITGFLVFYGKACRFSRLLLGEYIWFTLQVTSRDLETLTYVNRIRPNNVVLNQLFGGFTGLSLIPITFDVSHVGNRQALFCSAIPVTS